METDKRVSEFDIMPLLFMVLSGVGIVLCYRLFIPAMIVLPALWATAALRGKYGALVFVALMAFTVVFGLYQGEDLMLTLRMLMLVAPSPALLYLAHKYRMGNTMAALFLSFAITFGFFALFCLNSLLQGRPAFYEISLVFQSLLSTIETGFSANATLMATFNEYVQNIEIYFPSVLYVFGATYAFSNVLLLQLFNKRKKLMPLVPMRPFGQWRLPRPYVVACVIVMAVSLILSYTSSSAGRADMVLLLSNYMLNMPLSVIGAGMLFSFMTRNSRSTGRIILYIVVIVALVLFGLAMYTLSILGFLGCIGQRRRKTQA